jgi:hypothetical protein
LIVGIRLEHQRCLSSMDARVGTVSLDGLKHTVNKGRIQERGKGSPLSHTTVHSHRGREATSKRFPGRTSVREGINEDKCMCKLYAHERQAYKVMSRNHTPEDKCMCKLLPKNCHCTETEPKHRTPVDTKATNECTMHVINACTPTQLMHV